MKKYLLLFISFLCITTTAQEHNKQQMRMSQEEMRAKQQEFFTRHAELTEEESAAFFPLYFELQNKKQEANRRVWKQARAIPQDERTEADCEKMIDALTDVKIERAALEKEYIEKFKKILPPKKLLRILLAEDRYQRELLKNMQQGKPQGGKPQGDKPQGGTHP